MQRKASSYRCLAKPLLPCLGQIVARRAAHVYRSIAFGYPSHLVTKPFGISVSGNLDDFHMSRTKVCCSATLPNGAPMMRQWFTSDWHLGHERIIDLCNRPYSSLGEMHDDLVARWNSLVRPGDIGWFLGDMTWGNPEQFEPLIRQLNGYRVLILGNHDSGREQMLSAGFHRVEEQDFTNICALTAWLAHVPTNNQDDKHGFVRPRSAISEFDLALCGHVHRRWLRNAGDINVGVDAWAMNPVPENELFGLYDLGLQHMDIPSESS